MKLVQFVYPMFLVALGLHVAVMFVPIGGTPEAIVEDLELSDSPESADPTDRLSAPDPAALGDSLTAETGRLEVTEATRSVAPASPPRHSVRTIAASLPSSPPPVPPVSTVDESSPPPELPPTADPNLPKLPADNLQNAEENALVPRAAENSEQPTLGDLIASAKADLPPSLRQMVARVAAALTYREAETSDAIAQQKRADWEAKIRTQANVEAVENIAPTQIVGLTPISYPIQTAEDAEVLSYSACLEKAPHNAEVGMLFDSQGDVAAEPELIRSTGYGALNEEILATFSDIDSFSSLDEALTLESRRSKAYLFEVAVDYQTDTCVSLEKLRSVAEESND